MLASLLCSNLKREIYEGLRHSKKFKFEDKDLSKSIAADLITTSLKKYFPDKKVVY